MESFVKQTIIIFNNYLELGFICCKEWFYDCVHDKLYNRDISKKMSIVTFFNNSEKRDLSD